MCKVSWVKPGRISRADQSLASAIPETPHLDCKQAGNPKERCMMVPWAEQPTRFIARPAETKRPGSTYSVVCSASTSNVPPEFPVFFSRRCECVLLHRPERASSSGRTTTFFRALRVVPIDLHQKTPLFDGRWLAFLEGHRRSEGPGNLGLWGVCFES